jgi:hypothetical protein
MKKNKIEKIVENSGLVKLALSNSDEGATRKAIDLLIRDIIMSDGIIVYSKELPEELQTQIDQVVKDLKAIPAITDQSAAEKANKVLATGKRLLNKIKETGVEMRRALNDAAKDIKSFEDTIVSDLSAIVESVNNKITEFQRAEEKKRLEEEARIKKEAEEKARIELERINSIFSKIGKVRENIASKLAEVTTVEGCEEAIKKLNSIKFDVGVYMEFLSNVEEVKTEYIAKFEEKKNKIQKALQNQIETGEDASKVIDSIKEEGSSELARVVYDNSKELEETKINALKNIQMEAELKTSTLKGAKSVQRPWVYKGIADISKVPDEFLTVDETKVKAAIKAGCYQIPGLIIEQEIRNVSR